MELARRQFEGAVRMMVAACFVVGVTELAAWWLGYV
jgi:hypothetical protein